MSAIDDAYLGLVDAGRKKHARRAFEGIIALLWTHFSIEEVRQILQDQIDICEEYL